MVSLRWQGPHAAHNSSSALATASAFASVAAVLVALLAVGVGLHVARQERKQSWLAERQRALIELLTAFEAMRAFAVPATDSVAVQKDVAADGESPYDYPYRTAADQRPQEFEEARARWRANLYGSPEPLPFTRQAAFSHFGAGAPPANARLEGNPEVDSTEVRAVRGELVDALDVLRRKLQP